MDEDQRAIRKFYSTLVNTDRIEANTLFHSKVYYSRWALWERTGVWYTLDHVNTSMWLEGFLPVDEVESIPDWYVDKFMGGKAPDMAVLKKQVEALYRAKHPAPVSAELAAGEQEGVPWKV